MILDRKQRVIVALVGRPSDPSWDQAVEDAAAVMTEVQEEGLEEDCFLEKFVSHHRGEFVAFPVGVSFGGGQKVCLHLKPQVQCLASTRNQGTSSILQSVVNLRAK